MNTMQQHLVRSYINVEQKLCLYHSLKANTTNMIIIKLFALATFLEVAVGESSGPSPPPATLFDHDIFEQPQEVHKAFILKQEVKPTQHYRFGYEIHHPTTDMTTSQYEIRHNDVNMGIFNTLGPKAGQRSTVYYNLDDKGYRATLSVDSQHHTNLDYNHLPSPLASSVPPPTGKEQEFTHFLLEDRESIEKHSPEAKSAHNSHTAFTEHFHISPTQECIWGYEIHNNRSHYAIHHGGIVEGRVTMVNADGGVSSMDYTVDANNFNVSTVRHFGKQDISQLYLNPEQYPLLLQIARGGSTCDV